MRKQKEKKYKKNAETWSLKKKYVVFKEEIPRTFFLERSLGFFA